VGYLPPGEFLAESDRIRRNIGTIDDIKNKLTATPDDVALWSNLAAKYDTRGDYASALEVWEKVRDMGGEAVPQAQFKISLYATKVHQSPEFLLEYIENNPDSEFMNEAYGAVIQIFRKNKRPGKEVGAYTDWISYMERNKRLNADILNRYAWRMAELDTNLTVALEKIQMAVDMVAPKDSVKRAMFMDTKAEILWKLGRTKDALSVINNCIALQPDDDYYSKQKRKFLGR